MSDVEVKDQYEDEIDDIPSACWRCNGEGEIVICVDDICRNMRECMHGDGMILCPDCGGED